MRLRSVEDSSKACRGLLEGVPVRRAGEVVAKEEQSLV
jgi:hypothetical protein